MYAIAAHDTPPLMINSFLFLYIFMTHVQVTREAFTRYMRVIKRALIDAAAKESTRAAGTAGTLPDTSATAPSSASGQIAGASCYTCNTPLIKFGCNLTNVMLVVESCSFCHTVTLD